MTVSMLRSGRGNQGAATVSIAMISAGAGSSGSASTSARAGGSAGAAHAASADSAAGAAGAAAAAGWIVPLCLLLAVQYCSGTHGTLGSVPCTLAVAGYVVPGDVV